MGAQAHRPGSARVIGLEAEYAAKMAARGAAVPHDDGAETGSQVRPKRQRRTAMEYFAGLDVAMEETAICVIDREGKVMLETSATTDPDAIFTVLKKGCDCCSRSGAISSASFSTSRTRSDTRSRRSGSRSARSVVVSSRRGCASWWRMIR